VTGGRVQKTSMMIVYEDERACGVGEELQLQPREEEKRKAVRKARRKWRPRARGHVVPKGPTDADWLASQALRLQHPF
jgi:hypothetical protein